MPGKFETLEDDSQETGLDGMSQDQLLDEEDAAIEAKVAARRAGDEAGLKAADARLQAVSQAMENLSNAPEQKSSDLLAEPSSRIDVPSPDEMKVADLEADIASLHQTIVAHENLLGKPGFGERAQAAIDRAKIMIAGKESSIKHLLRESIGENESRADVIAARQEELAEINNMLAAKVELSQIGQNVDRWCDDDFDRFDELTGSSDLGVQDVKNLMAQIEGDIDDLAAQKRSLKVFEEISQERGESDQMYEYRQDERDAKIDLFNLNDELEHTEDEQQRRRLENDIKLAKKRLVDAQDDMGGLQAWERAS